MRVKVSHSTINIPVVAKATDGEVINPKTDIDINIPDRIFDEYTQTMRGLLKVYEEINAHVAHQTKTTKGN